MIVFIFYPDARKKNAPEIIPVSLPRGSGRGELAQHALHAPPRTFEWRVIAENSNEPEKKDHVPFRNPL
jgi:hypothetical protein